MRPKATPTINFVVFSALLLSCFACSSSNDQLEPHTSEVTTRVDTTAAFQDTVTKWELYMESSDEGLWEDSAQYTLHIEKIHTFGGEDNPFPPFYDPLFVELVNDTLLISDQSTQTLVCMDTTGTVLWKFGERGEGPGYFAGIGQIDVCGDTIAVINNGLCAVELVRRDGSFIERLSLPDRPQDISFINSKTLLVYSKAIPGGDVHYFDIQADSILFSFGDGEWTNCPTNSSYIEVWGTFIEPDKVVYHSHFEKKLIFTSISERTSRITEIRELPFDITPGDSSYHEELGMISYVDYPLYRSLFIGPHGAVNLVFGGLMSNGEMYNSENLVDYCSVTPIDRFSKEGEYLDSYCLPDSQVKILSSNNNGYMVGIQAGTGSIFGYRVTAQQ